MTRGVRGPSAPGQPACRRFRTSGRGGSSSHKEAPMSVSRGVTTIAVTGLLALGVAACGSSGGGSSGGSSAGSGGSSGQSSGAPTPTVPLRAGETPVGQSLSPAGKKRGGTLTVYTSEDFEHLDPGESYFTNDYGIDGATQRALFAYKPNTQNDL